MMDAVGGIERMIKAGKASGSLNIANRGLTYAFLSSLHWLPDLNVYHVRYALQTTRRNDFRDNLDILLFASPLESVGWELGEVWRVLELSLLIDHESRKFDFRFLLVMIGYGFFDYGVALVHESIAFSSFEVSEAAQGALHSVFKLRAAMRIKVTNGSNQ
jgi:hypothetical protein